MFCSASGQEKEEGMSHSPMCWHHPQCGQGANLLGRASLVTEQQKLPTAHLVMCFSVQIRQIRSPNVGFACWASALTPLVPRAWAHGSGHCFGGTGFVPGGWERGTCALAGPHTQLDTSPQITPDISW